MRNIIKIITVAFVIITLYSCNKETENDEVNGIEIGCPNPPFSMFLLINKNSKLYKEITNKEGKFNKERIYFYYKTNDNIEKKIHIDLFDEDIKGHKDYVYFFIHYRYNKELFTGKEEVLWIVNEKEKFPINIKGNIVDYDECTDFFKIDKVSFNGKELKFKYMNDDSAIIYLIE